MRQRGREVGSHENAHPLERLLSVGHDDEALTWLDEHLPRWSSATVDPDRLALLLRRWPARATIELAAAAPAAVAEVGQVVAAEALGLERAVIDDLCALSAPWAPELAAVGEASALIAAGRDDEALEALRPIGLRSPFRQTRLFLRGLSALYRGRVQEARRALGGVDPETSQGGLASALVLALEAEREASLESLLDARQALEPLGMARAIDGRLLRQLGQMVNEGRPNTALRAAARIQGRVDGRLTATLRRELPGVLIAAGLDWRKVVSRLERALPTTDASDPDDHRLVACCAESAGDLPAAVEAWESYLEGVTSGETSWAEPREVAAAVCEHLGALLSAAALRQETVYGVRHARRLGLWSMACDSFEQALEHDPDDLSTWTRLIEASGHLPDRREQARTLERFLRRFPEHPAALQAAASAAGDRGAFDKGRRFVRRAIALEPLNRELRDIEAELVTGKAFKKLKTGHHDVAARLLGELRQLVPRSTAARRLWLASLAAAAFGALGREDEREACLALTAVEGHGPWTRAVMMMRADEEVEGTLGDLPDESLQVLFPSEGPSVEDLRGVMQILEEYRDDRGGLSWSLASLGSRAAELGCDSLTEREDILRVLGLVGSLERRLQLLERACERYPADHDFVYFKYYVALSLDRGPEYFDEVEEEIEAVVTALGEVTEEDRESVLARISELHMLHESIERHRRVRRPFSARSDEEP